MSASLFQLNNYLYFFDNVKKILDNLQSDGIVTSVQEMLISDPQLEVHHVIAPTAPSQATTATAASSNLNGYSRLYVVNDKFLIGFSTKKVKRGKKYVNKLSYSMYLAKRQATENNFFIVHEEIKTLQSLKTKLTKLLSTSSPNHVGKNDKNDRRENASLICDSLTV